MNGITSKIDQWSDWDLLDTTISNQQQIVDKTYQNPISLKQNQWTNENNPTTSNNGQEILSHSTHGWSSLSALIPGLVLGVLTGCIISCVSVSLLLTTVTANGTTTTTTSAILISSTTTKTTITSTTTAYYSCSNFTVQFNWDYPNNDINTSSITWQNCCTWCLSNSSCTAFVFNNGTSQCWIKTKLAGAGSSTSGKITASL